MKTEFKTLCTSRVRPPDLVKANGFNCSESVSKVAWFPTKTDE